MFTGIVEIMAPVRGIAPDGPGVSLSVESPWDTDAVAIGDSVAVNGVCLTVVQIGGGAIGFQVGPETLARTNLGELRPGDRVNLERALLPTTRMSGHFVQGHIDGVARVAQRRREQDWEWLEFDAEPALTEQMVSKGSIAVDGVSLTLVTVSPGTFSVMLIPHTLANTTLGVRQLGSTVNIETDILGKYVLKAVRDLHDQP
jgi:riboflavin synthase